MSGPRRVNGNALRARGLYNIELFDIAKQRFKFGTKNFRFGFYSDFSRKSNGEDGLHYTWSFQKLVFEKLRELSNIQWPRFGLKV